jgi:hypothetical protein
MYGRMNSRDPKNLRLTGVQGAPGNFWFACAMFVKRFGAYIRRAEMNGTWQDEQFRV